MKPAEAPGGREVHEIGNASQKLYSCDLCPKKYALEVQQAQKRSQNRKSCGAEEG